MRRKVNRSHLFHFRTDEPELDRLLQPCSVYEGPAAVLNDTALTLEEKKAILASWASDACAVESQPALRHPAALGRPVSFDAVMAALQALDRVRTYGTKCAPALKDRSDSAPAC